MSFKNIKMYKSAGNCDDKHQRKAFIEATMVYTPEVLIENSPMSYVPPVTVKQPN